MTEPCSNPWFYTFGAIVSALHAREKSGHGARVDIAMLDAVLSILEHGLMHYAATGKDPERLGNRHPTITPFDTFDAADKAFVICAGNNALFAALCKSVGRVDLATDARFTDNDRRTGNAVAPASTPMRNVRPAPPERAARRPSALAPRIPLPPCAGAW